MLHNIHFTAALILSGPLSTHFPQQNVNIVSPPKPLSRLSNKLNKEGERYEEQTSQL